MQSQAPKNFIPEPFAYHEELTIDIQTLTNEGRGIGRVDSWAIMVPFVIPGERVRVRIFRNHSNYSEADCVEILQPSSHRIPPKCPLFGRCGGCQYQHIAYEEQLAWKRQHILDCLERIGKIHATVQPLIPSEKIYGYRTKLTPHFERHGAQCPIGFLANGCRHTILDVPQCPIASDAINAMLPELRKRIQQATSRHGTCLLRDCDNGVLTDFNAIGTTRIPPLTLQFPAGSFFQNNPYGLQAMLRHLQRLFQEHPHIKFLVDTYCGTGIFGLFLASLLEHFTGIEMDEKSVALAQGNLQQNRITNGTIQRGDAATIFESITDDPQKTAVLLDPPRKGTDAAFLQQLLHFQPQMIVYISCAPDTQARDLQTLLTDTPYRLTNVQPFDLFPQTKHIETIACLERDEPVK